MEVTILGYIAIILTFFCILKKEKIYLLLFSIFFSGFTGSSVVNISTISIQPSFYFLILYIVAFSFDFIICKRKIKKNTFFRPLLIFFIYCSITVFFPLILDNKTIYIMGQDGKYDYLQFSSSNIIHIGYLFLGFFIFTELTYLKKCYSANKIKPGNIDSYKKISFTERIYKYYKAGLYAVILICIYQMLAFKLNLPFDELFRQGVHGNIQGNRIYGPCIEASMLCYYLVPSLLLVWINKKSAIDYIFIILGCFIGFITYSSTFLIGIFLCIIMLIIVIIRKNMRFRFTKKKTIILVTFLICLVALISVNLDLVSKIFNMFVEKLNKKNNSGIERWDAFETMSLIGLRYPFGVGFGSSRSKDLFSTWLCNIGIVGMLLFFYMLFSYAKLSIKSRKFEFSLPYLIVVVLLLISVSEPYNIFIWVLMFFGYFGGKKNENINY